MSDLVLTAPERIAAMAHDASEHIRHGFPFYQANLASERRPAVDVEVGPARYTQIYHDMVEVEDTFTLNYLGHVFNESVGETDRNRHEEIAREAYKSIWRYFVARPQLQLQNARGGQPEPLGALAFVTKSNITSRANIGLYERTTSGLEMPSIHYWSWSLTLTVESNQQIREQLFANV